MSFKSPQQSFLEDGVNIEENKSIKMGASSNPNAARLAALQERKQNIEETLAKRNQELRQLCIQVLNLTLTLKFYPNYFNLF